LHEALWKAGVDSALVVMKGAGHGGPELQAFWIMGRILDFLDRALQRQGSRQLTP